MRKLVAASRTDRMADIFDARGGGPRSKGRLESAVGKKGSVICGGANHYARRSQPPQGAPAEDCGRGATSLSRPRIPT